MCVNYQSANPLVSNLKLSEQIVYKFIEPDATCK